MRKIVLACAVLPMVAVLTAASSAAPSGSDDGCLVVASGRGIVTLNAKGFVFGRFDQGQVEIDDPVAADGSVKVFGFQKKRLVTDTKTRYIGVSVRFRASGLFRIRLEAIGMDMSFAGKGTATLSSDNFFDAGKYSTDAASFCESRFQPMPETSTRVVIAGDPPPEKPEK
jgi:hypothetical protein